MLKGGEVGWAETQYKNFSHWKGEKVIVLYPNVPMNFFSLRPAREPLIFISHPDPNRKTER